METDYAWGAVVINPYRHYLLVLHASGNHWDHPKGHAEPGETPVETALREIAEEAEIEVEIINGFQSEAEWTLPDGRPKKVVYYLARHIGELKTKGMEGEILDTIWLPYHEAREKITYDSGKEVLDKAEKFLSSR
ncbi:MAG: NUDIX domain-containing protein [Spirochaetaceae bacterium]|nr:NUDIX domain-containing protein [Spirochaetaceae bacterium]